MYHMTFSVCVEQLSNLLNLVVGRLFYNKKAFTRPLLTGSIEELSKGKKHLGASPSSAALVEIDQLIPQASA